MDQYFSQIIGMPVVDQHGGPLGRIFNLVIDPATGKIVAFALNLSAQRIVAPIDVIEWTHELCVQDENDVIDADEIQQVIQIRHKHIEIFRNKVVTKEGQYLGRVTDFALDSKFFKLSRLMVAKFFLGIFPYQKRLIEAHEILEIHRKAIVVKNDREAIRLKPFQMPAGS